MDRVTDVAPSGAPQFWPGGNCSPAILLLRWRNSFSPVAMKVYIVLMVLAVVVGTLFDVYHKGSAKFYEGRRERSKALATRPLSGPETLSLALARVSATPRSRRSAGGDAVAST